MFSKNNCNKSRRLCASLVLAAVLFALSPVVARAEEVTMNFRDVEIRQIIESVGQITGKNFLVDPRVRGKVTILANDPVPEEAVYDVLLAVLRMHGFRALEGNNMTRIVAANVGNRFAPNTLPAELVTVLMPINNLNAAAVIPLVRPLMTPESLIVAHKETNMLIITELETNLGRIEDIIRRVDLKSVGEYEIIPLKHATAKEMVALLQRAASKQLRHLTEIIADTRTNRLVVTGPSKLRLPIRVLIAELDTPAEGQGQGELRVIALHYAKAQDMEKIVKGILASEQFLKLLVLGYQEEERAVGPRVITPATKKADKTTGSVRDVDKRRYTIQSDVATNSLIVGGTPPIIRAVERVVSQLDVPRPQVMIEAIIADVDDRKFSQIETRIGVFDPLVGTNSPFGSITANNYRGVLGIFDSVASSAAIGTVARVGIGGGNTLPIGLLITAINRDEDSRVLSTPAVLTLNNEKASVDVSDVRYVRTGQTTNSAGTTASFGRQEFGTKLTVTPQITEGEAVRLDIEQKHEDIVNARSLTSSINDYPVTKKREIITRVVVNNGDILVLGGLNSNTVREDYKKVPLLGDLPFIGRLFSGRRSDLQRQSLVVFIKPTILRAAKDAALASENRYTELRLRQLLHASGLKSLLPQQATEAILPKISKSSAAKTQPEANSGERKVRIIKVRKARKRTQLKRSKEADKVFSEFGS